LLDQPLAHQLVIGIGNRLRGDDGVGGLLAEQAGAMAGAVSTRTVHQLTPELAADLAALQRVLFIDAWLAPVQDGAAPPLQPRLDPLLPEARHGGFAGSHRLEPAQLLAITAALYGRAPAGAWLRVPAYDLGHGTALSPQLQASLPAARTLLRQWLQAEAAPA
jgi:hydrogenase maturation protease